MAPYFKLFGSVIGKKHLPVIPNVVTTMMAYGVTASFLLVYICDLDVMKYVPFYKDNLRFPYEDDKRVFILPRKEL